MLPPCGAYPVSARVYQVTSMKQISVLAGCWWLETKCRETSYRCFTNVEAPTRRDLPAPEGASLVGLVPAGAIRTRRCDPAPRSSSDNVAVAHQPSETRRRPHVRADLPRPVWNDGTHPD